MLSENKGSVLDLYGDLLSAKAVRERCFKIGEMAMNGNANWFAVNEPRFNRCVSLVKESCLKNYPDLNIPIHSRWRHFAVNGEDLWQHHTSEFSGSKLDLARSAVDLVFLSVLLDAGAGSKWRYLDPVTGAHLSRSEGLAAASIDLFFNHGARFEGDKGWILDVEALEKISRGKLGLVFQSSPENPLLGISGRAELLSRLASALNLTDNNSAGYSRPGSIVDECLAISSRSIFFKKQIDITTILEIILRRFSSIWPQGYTVDGDPSLHLGDCGYHSALETNDVTSGIVPFHKLSQWLTYSLVEPLQWAGIQVTNLDGLTGLPEYRNGGLLIDTGLLTPHDMELMGSKLSPESEAIVEWRALTVFMIDRIAIELRKSLKLNARKLPLGSVLQGGTWAAGRELALRLRKDGSPPLNISTEGTIF